MKWIYAFFFTMKYTALFPWDMGICDIPFGDTMSAVNITLAGIQELGCHLGPRPAQIPAPLYLQDPTNIRGAGSDWKACLATSQSRLSGLFIH